MFIWQFRNLIKVKSLLNAGMGLKLVHINFEISKKTGLHPFVIQKTLAQAKNFTFPQLKKIYQRLLKADLYIKTGKIDSKTVLDMLVIELTK